MPSPDSGTSTRTVVSAVRATSSSVCPTPTVSMRIRSKPKASSRSATSSVVVARPPCAPRVAIERMNTPGSWLADSMRMRAPNRAPPVKGLDRPPATPPALLRAVERDGAHGSRTYRHPLHPRRGGREDVELESPQQEPLARPRDAAQRLDQQSPH